MKKTAQLGTAALLSCMLLASLASASEGYPYRSDFSDTQYITTEDLNASFDDFLIVDVRSTMEFDVAHINNSKHIILGNASFIPKLKEQLAASGDRPVAFYCNGHTCKKSYKAAREAIKHGITNVYAYDSGIFDWITTYPNKATLLGESPANPNKIISKAEWNTRVLAYDDFKSKTGDKQVITIDVRDPFQRDIVPDFKRLRNIPLDRFINMVKSKKFQDKQLMIFDAVGKQAKWLQYYLEDNGYTNYYFLKKGAISFSN